MPRMVVPFGQEVETSEAPLIVGEVNGTYYRPRLPALIRFLNGCGVSGDGRLLSDDVLQVAPSTRPLSSNCLQSPSNVRTVAAAQLPIGQWALASGRMLFI